MRRLTAVPSGGASSELSLVVDAAAGACAPSVGARPRLRSGEVPWLFRGTFRAEGFASGSAYFAYAQAPFLCGLISKLIAAAVTGA